MPAKKKKYTLIELQDLDALSAAHRLVSIIYGMDKDLGKKHPIMKLSPYAISTIKARMASILWEHANSRLNTAKKPTYSQKFKQSLPPTDNHTFIDEYPLNIW